MPGPPMGMPGPPMGMPGPPSGMPGGLSLATPNMGPPGGLPSGMGRPSPLPGSTPEGESVFDFSTDDVYKYVSNMEEYLLSKKNKLEPFKLAQQLGFTDPEVFYNFVVNLNREDLIRFDGGKIVVEAMTPVDTEEFLKKFENYLKTGRIT
jgi:hypothetical protein